MRLYCGFRIDNGMAEASMLIERRLVWSWRAYGFSIGSWFFGVVRCSELQHVDRNAEEKTRGE